MPVGRMRDSLERAEKFLEDLIVVILSIFVIILAVSALTVLSGEAPASVEARIETIGMITQMGFLAKAEYFAALLLPWVAMIIALLLVRELWLIRRRIEGIHFDVFWSKAAKKKR